MRFHDLFSWFLRLAFVFLILIFILQLWLKLTGHSPTELQLLYIGFSGLFICFLRMNSKFSLFMGEMQQFKHDTYRRFDSIDRRFDRVDVRLDRIDEKLNALKC